MGWGTKKRFFAQTELSPNISLLQNMISTIRKKLVNLQGNLNFVY